MAVSIAVPKVRYSLPSDKKISIVLGVPFVIPHCSKEYIVNMTGNEYEEFEKSKETTRIDGEHIWSNQQQ